MRYLIPVLVCCGAAIHGAASRADTIKFVDGRKPVSNVTVTDETVAKVEYKRRNLNQPQNYPADVVADVDYADAPEEYKLAVENLQARDFKSASDLFKTAAASERQRKGLQAKALFLAAEALRQSGAAKEAIAAYDELLQQSPDSRYAPQARAQRGVAQIAAGDESGARATFQALLADSTSKGYGDRWRYEAELRITALDEAKDPAKAQEAYNRIVAATQKDFPAVANQAKLRIGSAMIARGEVDKAVQYFQTIIDERSSSSNEVVAGAYTGLGRALYAKQKYKEALFCFLRVTTTYADVDAQQPEANYFAGKCFQQVEGADSQARARQHLSRVLRDYPDSPWALEAKKG